MVMHDIIFVFFKGEEVPSCDFFKLNEKGCWRKNDKINFPVVEWTGRCEIKCHDNCTDMCQSEEILHLYQLPL